MPIFFVIYGMEIQQAKARYAELKSLSRAIKKELEEVREFIRSKGIDPDFNPERGRIVARNKEIYIAWKDGQRLNPLAHHYKLSATTIRKICRTIDTVLETKRHTYEDYKDLLPYKG